MAVSTSSRLPSTIVVSADGTSAAVRPPAPVPLRRQQFTDARPIDARQLNTAIEEIHAATLPARTYGRNQAKTFEGLTFDSSASPSDVRLQHNLGGKVRWSLVRWVQPSTGTVTGANIYEPNRATGQQGSQQDPDVLVLKPTASTLGVADIEVWRAG